MKGIPVSRRLSKKMAVSVRDSCALIERGLIILFMRD